MIDFITALTPAALIHHAPALVVTVPLILSAFTAIMPSSRAAWGLCLSAALFVGWMVILLFGQLATQDVIVYAMGGWDAPMGITYRVDALNLQILALVASIGLLCVIYGYATVKDEIAKDKRPLFYSAFLICFAGLLGVTITGDAFNVFVFVEISSLATYALIAMGAERDRRALTASYNYLVLGTIGATFFVIGVGFLYMATGTLNMADMAGILAETGHTRVTQAAFAFIVVGLGLKAAMFPLHVWLPNAYATSPSFVTAFLASTATKVAFYALIRFLYAVYTPDTGFVMLSFTWVFAVVGVVGMILASVQALFQSDPRRLLAYSSVAQVGYMMLGLGLGNALGLAAALMHLVNHAIMKGALFMALGAFGLKFGISKISDLNGLGRTMPASAAAFTVAGISLIGIPLTIGFTSKWYLIIAVLERGWWWAVAAVIMSSLLALAYITRMLAAIWMENPPEHHGETVPKTRAPAMVLVPMGLLAFANVYFFFNADFIVGMAQRAASAVMGGQ
ncbi:MAG: monovalent cation/H+ antiporter subunit D family protein [Maricaulis sp.]|nr:monovalent cation/H+ antiporter subunit D family protein [Maricaulis sp.]MDG2045238.1 monovalent cation/H+ antiporter subunit D family protein [Maricaulis sp.]